jgi:hypothetical protein
MDIFITASRITIATNVPDNSLKIENNPSFQTIKESGYGNC